MLQANNDGLLPLHVAAVSGSLGVLYALLAAGANLFATDQVPLESLSPSSIPADRATSDPFPEWLQRSPLRSDVQAGAGRLLCTWQRHQSSLGRFGGTHSPALGR